MTRAGASSPGASWSRGKDQSLRRESGGKKDEDQVVAG